jgi:integrase
MAKLNPRGLAALIKRSPKRHPDGNGLFFKVAGQGKAYWTFRYSLGGKESETSLGPYPEMSLDQARIRHLELRAAVAKKIDPVGERRKGDKAPVLTPSGAPTFGHCADQFIGLHEKGWKNARHHAQWVATLKTYVAPIRSKPVNEITTADVLACLQPIWNEKPETASRLRGRIEAVIASAQVDGWIPEDRPNPARWKNWLDRKLPQPKKLGSRGHHPSMPYAELPVFMAKLAETPGVAALALRITILTCARTGEALGMTWDEVIDKAIWRVPASRMKMGREHEVPLSDQALAILRDLKSGPGNNPHVFPGRPMRSLSNMAMSMMLRRLGHGDVTVHGFRSAARSWMADTGVPFEVAEACLAHTVGNAVVQAYQRSSMLELRRPVLQKWADFICPASNVVSIKREVA